MNAMKSRVYLYDPAARTKLKKLDSMIKRASKGEESKIVQLVEKFPREILGGNADAVWFWKPSNGPCDLWGINRKGGVVLIECKGRGRTEKDRVSRASGVNQIKMAEDYLKKWATKAPDTPIDLAREKMGVDLSVEYKRKFGKKLKINFKEREKFIVHYRTDPNIVQQIISTDPKIKFRFLEWVKLEGEQRTVLVVSGS